MNQIPIKKLIVNALYMVLLLVALSIIPITSIKSLSFEPFLKLIQPRLLIVMVAWAINILLLIQFSKFESTKKRTYFRYFLSFLIVVSTMILIRHIFPTFNFRKPPHLRPSAAEGMAFIRDNRISFGVLFSITINTVILVVQDLIVTKNNKTLIELENSKLKVEYMEAINLQLRQQLHPHFLFNSLNTLKSLIKTEPAIAEEYLIQLSDFIRGSLSTSRNQISTLGEELQLCSDYLSLQKIRFKEALNYTVSVPEHLMNNKYVPTFSIQLLIENAIKHNTLTIASPLWIKVMHNGDQITVLNKFNRKQSVVESSGIGLNNLSERYKGLIGKGVRINNTEHIFSVSIKILNDGDCNNRG